MYYFFHRIYLEGLCDQLLTKPRKLVGFWKNSSISFQMNLWTKIATMRNWWSSSNFLYYPAWKYFMIRTGYLFAHIPIPPLLPFLADMEYNFCRVINLWVGSKLKSRCSHETQKIGRTLKISDILSWFSISKSVYLYKIFFWIANVKE